MLKRFINKTKDSSQKHREEQPSAKQGSIGRGEEGPSGGRNDSLSNVLKNGYGHQEYGSSPPRQSVDRCIRVLRAL